MNHRAPAYFDLKTVALLRETVDDAWISIRPEQRASVSRSLLAERVLKAAAQGERDRARLLEAALAESRRQFSEGEADGKPTVTEPPARLP
jgi:regulator of protease activity HflC (stomatin/prohibitin superfamily)